MGLFKKMKQMLNSNEDLNKWRSLYETAKTKIDRSIYDDMYKQYKGTKYVRKDVNNKNSNVSAKLANNVRQVSYEMVESQVNTIIPEPLVRSMRNGFSDLGHLVQDKIKNDLETSSLEILNDRVERLVPIYGWGAILLDWDVSKRTMDYIGEKCYDVISPRQILPQPGVYDFKKMDYFFIEIPTTKKYIFDKYGVDVFSEMEENPGLNSLDDNSIYKQDGNVSDESVTLVKVYYKDEEGDVGVYVFVNNTEVANYPKYYYPKFMKCDKCGKELPQGAEECTCGSKTLAPMPNKYDEIEEELELEPIVESISKKKIDIDEQTGLPTVKTVEEEAITRRLLEKGDKVPRYMFKDYPIVVRVNTPDEYKIGQSDLEVIADQHTALSKIVSRIEEKIMKGGSIIVADAEMRAKITNELYQIVTGTAGQAQTLRVLDLTNDIAQEIEAARFYYEMVQSTLGISDSFQGKYDPSAKSGRAKEVQVQQSAGRLSSKLLNKYAFFKDLFNLMFKFDLCFTSESRSFVKKDSNNNDEWTSFNKYDFLMQSKNGDWYYNDQFIITAESGNALPNDKVFIMEQTVAQASAGLITPEQYWEILKTLNYPNASSILSQMQKQKEEIEQQQIEQMQQEAQMAQPMEEQTV